MGALAFGMALTIPVAGLALYLTGGSLSYIEPLLLCSLLYAAFFFPPRWAWPLVAELVLVAGTPLLYDPDAIENAYLPRYLALVAAFLAATAVMTGLKRRLVEAEARQRDFANRDPLTGVGNRRNFDLTLKRELTAAHQPAPQPPRHRPDAARRAADRPRRLQGRQRPPRPPGRRRGPGRGRQPRPRDAALDRHPGPDRRRRVRRDRPRRPRRGRAADGRVDPRRGQHPRARRPGAPARPPRSAGPSSPRTAKTSRA